MDLVRASLVLVVLVMVGCGDGGPAPVAVQPPAQATGSDAVKLILDGVASSGELGSGAEGLRTAVKALNKPELLADVDALEGMTDPEAAKAKAKEMIGKL
jgi:hypothetical protein